MPASSSTTYDTFLKCTSRDADDTSLRRSLTYDQVYTLPRREVPRVQNRCKRNETSEDLDPAKTIGHAPPPCRRYVRTIKRCEEETSIQDISWHSGAASPLWGNDDRGSCSQVPNFFRSFLTQYP